MLGFFSSIRDNLSIFFKQFRSSYRRIVVTSVGLLISLSIIASVSVMVRTERSYIIEEAFKNQDLTFSISGGRSDSNVSLVKEIVNTSLEESGLQDYIASVGYLKRLYVSIKFNSTSDPYSQNLNVIEFEHANMLIPYLENGSRLTGNQIGNQSAIFLSVPYYDPYSGFIGNLPSDPYANITLNGSYQIDLRVYSQSYLEIPIMNVTVTGKGNLNRKIFEDDFLRSYVSQFGGNSLLVSNISAFIEELDSKSRNEPGYPFHRSSNSIIYPINKEKINILDIESERDKFWVFTQSVRNLLLVNRLYDWYFYDQFASVLEGVVTVIQFLFIVLTLFSLPIVVVSLFLSVYSFGLVRKQKLIHLGVLLTRGLTRTQILIVLCAELLVSLSIAIVGSVLLSLPLTSIIVQSSDFLSFNRTNDIIFLIPDLLILLAQVGLVFVILGNFLYVVRLSKLTIQKVDQFTNQERDEPLWKRKFLDIVLLVSGLVCLYLLNTNSTLTGDFLIYLPLLLATPVLLLSGFLMFMARIFSISTMLLAKLLWNIRGNLFSFSLKNVTRHRQASVRAILLVAVTLAFCSSFVVFPYTLYSNVEEQIQYRNGADMFVGLKNATNYMNSTLFESVLGNISDDVISFS